MFAIGYVQSFLANVLMKDLKTFLLVKVQFMISNFLEREESVFSLDNISITFQ